jgi:hypothetical protein
MSTSGAEEVLALLTAISNHTVYDGKVSPNTPPPYTVVYFTVQTPTGEQAPDAVDLIGNSDVINLSIYVHNVGGSAQAARNVSWKVRAALLNVKPVVAGRVCHPIRQVDDAPPVKDESTGTLIMDLADVYRLRSVPA